MAMSVDIEMEEKLTYNVLFATVPIRALNLSCRRKLALALNPKMSLPAMSGYSRDWQGLVEAIGYEYEVNKLLSNREDPTMALLDLWEKHVSNPTIANLLEGLQKIERFDVITDILPLLERDAQRYLKSEEEDRRLTEKPIQVPIVTSEKTTVTAPFLTLPEVEKSSSLMEESSTEEDEYIFDAYVSYVESDLEFVTKLIDKLEGEHDLRLFVKDRDMLAGFDEAAADVRIIYERCKRILLIISPEFLSDPKCEFTTMFAQALAVDNNLYARKVIPVICKPCELSVRLRYIARVDYTKRDIFGKFWDRLYYSIKNPILGELPSSTGTGTISSHVSLHPEEASTSTSGSTESLVANPSRMIKPSNLTPMPDDYSSATTSGFASAAAKECDSAMDPQSSSSMHLSTPKSTKKKKSPLSKRKFLSFGRTRNNAQTQ